MPMPPRSQQRKTTFRRHFLKEWLEERGMKPMEFLEVLNDAAGVDAPPIDKGQVYRWLKGQLPRRVTQERIAAALSLVNPQTGEPEPERFMMHPANDWLARKLTGRSIEDIKRAKQAVELILPDPSDSSGDG